jgi:hypothetical protein
MPMTLFGGSRMRVRGMAWGCLGEGCVGPGGGGGTQGAQAWVHGRTAYARRPLWCRIDGEPPPHTRTTQCEHACTHTHTHAHAHSALWMACSSRRSRTCARARRSAAPSCSRRARRRTPLASTRSGTAPRCASVAVLRCAVLGGEHAPAVRAPPACGAMHAPGSRIGRARCL